MLINKYSISISAVLLSCLAFCFSGCTGGSEKGTVIASIGSSEITLDDLNERISNLPPRYRQIVQKRKDEFLEEIINDKLLYQEAVRSGLAKEKDVQEVIQRAKEKILIARLLKDRVEDPIEVTDEEILEFYNTNNDKYMTPEIMRVSHILVPSEAEAEAIRARIASGEDFEAIARAKSVDPTAQRGGDIGYFPKGQLMPKFEQACAELDVGEVSGVVKTKLGYHIIKLTDRKPPELRPLDQVKDDIISKLRTIEKQQRFNELMTELREKTSIKINEEALAGDYTTEGDVRTE
ncbi:MAG: hypothetical protein GF409_02900 [Candidatus Omnitrophica bacterium]|nr:hypothetical protein [Candidatus Omnitrophota bacterium]